MLATVSGKVRGAPRRSDVCRGVLHQRYGGFHAGFYLRRKTGGHCAPLRETVAGFLSRSLFIRLIAVRTLQTSVLYKIELGIFMGTLSHSLFVRLISLNLYTQLIVGLINLIDEVLGFTRFPTILSRLKHRRPSFLCTISFGFPFNPTYELDLRKY